MTNLQILICIVFAIILGFGIAKVIEIRKDKTIDEKKKEQEITNVIITIVKSGLEMTTITSQDDLEKYCINKAQQNIKKLGYTDFSDEDISIAVKLILKSMQDILDKKFKK